VAGGVGVVFDVKAITAQSLTLFGDFETAFGFNLSAVGTSEFHFDFGGAGSLGAGSLVVSLLLANRASRRISHRNRNRLSVDSTQK
jgi:hypothetical protein